MTRIRYGIIRVIREIRGPLRFWFRPEAGLRLNVVLFSWKLKMTFWFWVAVRIIVNPLSNVFQKLLVRDHLSPLFVVGATYGLLAVPCAVEFAFLPLPVVPEFWQNMAIATALALAGNVLIVQALSTSDLSFLGPVNAYKSIVSLLPGVLLLREIPTPKALSGIVLIVSGSYLIVDKLQGSSQSVFFRFFSDRGVQYRLVALVLSATEAVFLKRALLAASPLTTFGVWAIAGFILFVIVAPISRGRSGVISEARTSLTRWLPFLALAATTGLMQLSTLIVLQGFQVAAALALFQTSILLTVFLGWKVFRERNVVRRFLGAVAMVAGAVLIVVG